MADEKKEQHDINIDYSGLKKGEQLRIERDSNGRPTKIVKENVCFPAGTSIASPRRVIDISSAKVGDLVLAFDPRRNVLRPRRILKVCKPGTSRIWEFGFTDGRRLRTTASHALRIPGAWRQARHVGKGKGDVVCCIDGSGRVALRQVACSSPTSDVEEVFNMIVEGEFSFVADGVVAHNFSYFRSLRVFWWTVYGTLRGWAANNGTGRESTEAALAGR